MQNGQVLMIHTKVSSPHTTHTHLFKRTNRWAVVRKGVDPVDLAATQTD